MPFAIATKAPLVAGSLPAHSQGLAHLKNRAWRPQEPEAPCMLAV